MTQLVGRFVELACPSSSLDATNTYGICASSESTGRWDMMSIGFMSAARTSNLAMKWRECRKQYRTDHLPLFSFANALHDLLYTTFDLPSLGC